MPALIFEEPVVQLAVGGSRTCVLLEGGSVHCWGIGAGGVLGYGNTEDIGDDELASDTGAVDLDGPAVQLAVDGGFACALMDAGNVRCWGQGDYGSLGYGDTESIGDDELPSSVGFVDVGGTVTKIRAGSGFACALLDAGGIRCWGEARWGKLGYGNLENIGDDDLPSSAGDVDVGGPAVDVQVGQDHACALLEGGETRCWGRSNYGQLGHGDFETIGDDELPSAADPVDIGGVVVELALGTNHTCAIVDEGRVRCWGANWSGQLGYGHTEDIGDDEPPSSAGEVEL